MRIFKVLHTADWEMKPHFLLHTVGVLGQFSLTGHVSCNRPLIVLLSLEMSLSIKYILFVEINKEYVALNGGFKNLNA